MLLRLLFNTSSLFRVPDENQYLAVATEPIPNRCSPSAAVQRHSGPCSHQTFGTQGLGGCLGVPRGSLPSSTSSSPTPPAVPPRPGRPRARHSCASAARWAARRQGLAMSRDDAPSAGGGLGVVSRGIRSWCGNVSVHSLSAAPLPLVPVPSRGQPRGAGDEAACAQPWLLCHRQHTLRVN